MLAAMYVSPDGESITELGKSTDILKGKDNYRNCVVALKRSWSFKVRKFIILVKHKYKYIPL